MNAFVDLLQLAIPALFIALVAAAAGGITAYLVAEEILQDELRQLRDLLRDRSVRESLERLLDGQAAAKQAAAEAKASALKWTFASIGIAVALAIAGSAISYELARRAENQQIEQVSILQELIRTEVLPSLSTDNNTNPLDGVSLPAD